MPRLNAPSVITISFNRPAIRWLLLLPAALAILATFFVVRWYVGNTVAEYGPAADEDGIEMARMAVRWAPDDPLTHWRLGSYNERTFTAENMSNALREYQMAVTLSPNDYRYWFELSRAFEAVGDRDSSEKAMRRTVELAPAYSQPLWYFGNLLLRQGKLDQAFQQLARAAEADPQIQPQVFNLAWQVFDGDVDSISRIACPSPAIRIRFAIYLVGLGRAADAMRIWATISTPDRRDPNGLSEELKKSLIDAKQFHSALEIMREIESDSAELPVPEHFSNPGFESDLALSRGKSFNWAINSGSQLQIGRDTHISHTGNSSLKLAFRAPKQLDSIRVTQTVVVEPDTQYRFECYVRTNDLISASTPQLLIISATDNTTLVTTASLSPGTSDWQRIAFEFKTKAGNEGITLVLWREACTVGSICPIFGTIWYDDFNLQRVGGPGASRRAADSGKR